MKQFSGKCVNGHTVIGKIEVFRRMEMQVLKESGRDYTIEVSRFQAACVEAIKQLHEIYELERKHIGEENAFIFEMQTYLILDESFKEEVEQYLKANLCNAEYAVHMITNEYVNRFRQSEEELLKEKVADLKDVCERIINCLNQSKAKENTKKEPVIILAGTLTPSETISLDKDNILGFVLTDGGIYSHAVILAKSMNIPCMIQTNININPEYDGKVGAIDATNELFWIDIDEKKKNQLEEEYQSELKKDKELQRLIHEENRTKSGKKIGLMANIERFEDVQTAIQTNAEGIGLFRSEFLYMSKHHLPSEEEQIIVYRKVLQSMKEKPVVIRTIDIGADKESPLFHLGHEENPAMGMRAIRLCIKEKEIFKTQLRAMLRANEYHNLSILVPMITSLDEVKKVKEILKQVEKELRDEKHAYGKYQLGIMVETPAAAIISDELAKEVDFFSIGTNDLAQYTLAVDRNNANVEQYYNPYHKAVLELIQMTTENAHKNKIKVAICGELACDLKLTEKWLEFGIDELSVATGEILKVRKNIRELN